MEEEFIEAKLSCLKHQNKEIIIEIEMEEVYRIFGVSCYPSFDGIATPLLKAAKVKGAQEFICSSFPVLLQPTTVTNVPIVQ